MSDKKYSHKYPPGAKFHFFYASSSPFSQFYPAQFTARIPSIPNNEEKDNNLTFATSEHWMHYYKAILFNDYVVAKQILANSDPARAKELGRTVHGFNEKIWKKHRVQIVLAGNIHKFKQNPECKEALMATGTKFLVEASPTDSIWGIGMKATDPRAKDSDTWNGDNLLGKVLDHVKLYFHYKAKCEDIRAKTKALPKQNTQSDDK